MTAPNPNVLFPPPRHAEIARRLLQQAWPVLAAQLLSVSMMFADTVIAGRYGTADLAGVAVGSSFYISVMMLLSGILQAVAPTVAHHVGAGREDAIGPALQQGFWLALLLGLPGTWLLAHPEPLFRLTEVPEAVAAKATDYLSAAAFGLPAVLLYKTFYAFINAVGRPRALMAISAVVTASHVPLAWTLTHGGFGIAALGGAGCGWSTAAVNWLALACGLAFMLRDPLCRRHSIFAHWQGPRRRAQLELLRLGLPMGLSTFVDITSFTLIALLVSKLGAETVAGHRVVANLTGMVYMVPLSLAISTLVLVGQAAGAQDWRRARASARVGLMLAATTGTLVAALLWLARDPLIAFATTDAGVRVVALGLIAWLCAYQWLDGFQLVAAYSLRGYKVTLLPMVLHTLCFWGLGLLGGYWLCFGAPWRLDAPAISGFWQGCVIATLVAALVLTALLQRVSRQSEL